MTELDHLERKIAEQVDHHALALARGNCKDFGEYQRVCGIIYGLGLAKTEIQDLRKKLKELDDE